MAEGRSEVEGLAVDGGEDLMGTSSSNKGPGPNAPLVPPWADDPETPAEPNPPPVPDEVEDTENDGGDGDDDDDGEDIDGGTTVPQDGTLHLAGFRRTLGNAVGRGVSGGTRSELSRALGSYSRATGGGGITSRRLASVTRSGGRVFTLFSTGSATGPGGRVITLVDLTGRSIRVVVDAIVAALVSADGDRDKVAAALQEALATALDGVEEFDPDALTADVLVRLLVSYLHECIFATVIADSGRAFQRTGDDAEIAAMERELHALVGEVVDQEMRPMFASITGMSEAQVVTVQGRAIEQVWDVWEQPR